MLFTEAQFIILIVLGLFALFFHQGYTSTKKSGGFFLLFAGFLLLSLSFLIVDLVSILVSGLMVPFAGFIMLLGVMKTFFSTME